MPNSNYISGRNFEYEVMQHYRKHGYTVMRTAGSHGPFDIVAVKAKIVDLIQCKRVSTQAEVNRLIKEFREAPTFKPLELPIGVHQVLAIKLKGKRGIWELQYV